MTNSGLASASDNNAIRNKLGDVMSREIRILRELLASLQEEQQAIIMGRAELISCILKEREPLMDSLHSCRNKRLRALKQLASSSDGDLQDDGPFGGDSMDSLLGDSDSSCELLVLRDQILALLDEAKSRTERNNYLVENKVALTKEMIRRLYPADDNGTYSKDGSPGGKTTTTVTIINREG